MKVRNTSSQCGLYKLGYSCATMKITERNNNYKLELIFKNFRSSDYRLKLICMKLESLVIANQQYCGEFVPWPCTHRPSHVGS